MSRVVAVSCVLMGALVLVSFGPTSREQVRLRAHFDSVLIELRARDVSTLSRGQRASRDRLLGWLAEYRDAGRFPLNDRYANEATPIFRDARGATCAMAYLIERSGRRDIVDRVATTRNLAYVGELVDDPAIVAWLDSVGFELEEAARVQPTYGTPESRRNVDREYAVWSMMASGASLITATWNLAKPNRVVGVLGLLTGGFTVLVGLVPVNADATQTDGDGSVATLNIISGGAAIVAGLWAIGRRQSRSASSPVPDSQGTKWGLALDPVLQSGNGAQGIRLGVVGRF